MKKITAVILIAMLVSSCYKEDLLPVSEIVSQDLQINRASGIKLATTFVTDEVSMNVKMESSGTVSVKILDITNKVVSKETMQINAGDNILKVYTRALPKSAYRIALYDSGNNLIGITDFNKL
jgi:hypothetical protein